MIKPLFTVKALALGWSVTWRAFLVVIVNAILVSVLGALVAFLGDALASLYNIIAGIYMLLMSFMATGWAVMRIKDKL
jgi:hypothetical protein